MLSSHETNFWLLTFTFKFKKKNCCVKIDLNIKCVNSFALLYLSIKFNEIRRKGEGAIAAQEIESLIRNSKITLCDLFVCLVERNRF